MANGDQTYNTQVNQFNKTFKYYFMKQITLDKDSIFTIVDTDLRGNLIPDKVISSHHFMMFESKKLETVKDKDNFAAYIWEYSAILKALLMKSTAKAMAQFYDTFCQSL